MLAVTGLLQKIDSGVEADLFDNGSIINLRAISTTKKIMKRNNEIIPSKNLIHSGGGWCIKKKGRQKEVQIDYLKFDSIMLT